MLFHRQVRRHVVDRPLVELERLLAGRDPARLAGGGERGAEGLGSEAGALVVARRVDDARPIEVHHELSRLGVEPAQLRRWHGAVDRIAQQLVSEVVVAAVDVVEGIDDRRVDELLERRLELGKRPVDDPGHHVGREAAPDHGARARDRPRIG